MRPRLLPLLALALVLSGCARTDGGTGDPQGNLTPTAGGPTPATPAPGPASNLTAALPREALNATAGRSASFALTLANAGASPARVDALLRGEGAGGSVEAVDVPAGGSVTVFVPVKVDAGAAPGARALAAILVDARDGREVLRRDNAATVRVVEASGGYAPGDEARILYVGRLADTGQVFNTNDPLLEDLPFARTDGYSFTDGLLEVRSLPRPTVIDGFHEGILGMAAGESRTFTFPPGKGYGPAVTEERFPRQDVVDRRETLPLPESRLSLAEFQEFLNATGQGNASDHEAGDLVRAGRGGGPELRYRIVEKDAQGVRLRLHVEVGERYTVHAPWVNGSVVENATEDTVTFVTTPTQAPDEPFTFHSYWPDASRVVALNETAIVVRHDPAPGTTFTTSRSQFGEPQDFTVVSLDEESVVASAVSTNPLAGKALTFDAILVELVRGAQE